MTIKAYWLFKSNACLTQTSGVNRQYINTEMKTLLVKPFNVVLEIRKITFTLLLKQNIFFKEIFEFFSE